MENKKQSSVDWLKDELEELFISTPYLNWDAIFNKAKEIHKEETILFAHNYHKYLEKQKKGISGAMVEMDAEQYYNKTFIQ